MDFLGLFSFQGFPDSSTGEDAACNALSTSVMPRSIKGHDDVKEK